MSPFELVQALVVGAVVIFSVLSAFRKLMPETSRRLFGRLSAALDRPDRSLPVRYLGRCLQPSQARGGGCGSGDGCGSCGGCGPAPAPQPLPDPHLQVLHIRPRH